MVDARHHCGGDRLPWLTALQRAYVPALLLDRHYLAPLEQDMCIASLDEQLASPCDVRLLTIDGLRLVLAARFGTQRVQPRELPVSLLRLYFSGTALFYSFIDAAPQQGLQALLALVDTDALPASAAVTPRPPLDATSSSTLDNEQMAVQKDRLATLLCFVLDAAFCSFERTLWLMATHERATWPDFGLRDALATDPYWANMPSPATGAFSASSAATTHLVWYASLWRINVTLELERWLKPWHGDAQREWLLYRLQLFRDTHLDLLTVMVARNLYSDAEVSAAGLLRLYWPACDRVCCVEELPDLSCYALDNWKTGSHLKERSTLHDKLGHIFFNKTHNNICKDRNFFDIVVRYGEQDEIIYDLVKLISKCVLLGNLPRARGSLCMAARLRVNWSFWPEQADRVLSEAEVYACMPPYRNPYLMEETKRQQKAQKEAAKGVSQAAIDKAVAALRRKQEQAAYDKTCFKMWMLKCPYFVASLMKEFMINVMEATQCIDEILALDFKWTKYKQIIRIANGQCRQELATQARRLALGAPFDWAVIEWVEKSPDRKYDIKSGKIMEFHAMTLKVAKKVMKRNFMGILEVKATGTEERIVFDRGAAGPRIYREPGGGDDEGGDDQRPTKEELHFIAWYMAQSDQRVMETRWYQCVGMTAEGLANLREWLFQYYTYDVADDSYKRKLERMQRHKVLDHFIIKTLPKLEAYYRRKEYIFYLPAQMARNAANAQRRHQLHIGDNEPTPPLLGVAFRCHGCLKFASAVVRPLDFTVQSNYSELVRAKNQIYSDAHPYAHHPQMNGVSNHSLVLYSPQERRTRLVETYKTRVARPGQPKNERRPSSRDYDAEKHDKELIEEESRRRRENISYLTVAFYNIADGQAYCVRNRRRRVLRPVGGATTRANVIVRSRYDDTRIESSLFQTRIEVVSPGGDAAAGHTVTASSHDDDDEEDGEEDDDEPAEADDEDDDVARGLDFRPAYETNPLLLNPNLHSLGKEARDRLQQFASQAALDNPLLPASSTTTAPTGRRQSAQPRKKATTATTENNKKYIAREVQEPLHSVYNCQCPLQPIDMDGVVVDGKTRCVECGVITEYQNFNMTPRGPVCMRHANVAFTQNHPVWQMDTQAVVTLQHQRGHDTPQQQDAQKPRHRNQRRPHPSDTVQPQFVPYTGCEACGTMGATMRVPCYDTHFHLSKLACCPACFRRVRAQLARDYVVARATLVIK